MTRQGAGASIQQVGYFVFKVSAGACGDERSCRVVAGCDGDASVDGRSSFHNVSSFFF